MKNLQGKILIIDDEPNIRDGLKKILMLENHEVDIAENGKIGFELALKQDYDVIICDLKMPIMDGTEFLVNIIQVKHYLKIIMLTGHGTISNAVESIKQGAFDFFIKPLIPERILITIQHALRETFLQRENRGLKDKITTPNSLGLLVGKSKTMMNIIKVIGQVAQTKATVLIEGESGTGKELVARSIHELSDRRNEPLISVHPAAFNENLLETELFGYEKGAFTGALQTKKGRFELANKGSIFLDEIGEISSSTQVKLLRVLQEQVLERVGGGVPMSIDVRIIAATNRNLFSMVKQGEFREDLYYRLNVVNIKMPSLRERKEDIPLLVEAFLKELCFIHGKTLKTIQPEAIKVFEQYFWPGNIRELRNIIEGMVILSPNELLGVEDLPLFLQSSKNINEITIPDKMTLKEVEKTYILEILKKENGNKTKTAERLGIERKTLYKKLAEYGEYFIE